MLKFILEYRLQRILSKHNFIEGLEKITHGNGNKSFKFFINKDTDIIEISRLLNSIPIKTNFSFYDDAIPQWSDPGAYYTIVKNYNCFYFSAGNHGWSTKNIKMNIEDLANIIKACINYNNTDYQRFRMYISFHFIDEAQSLGSGLGNEIFKRIKLLKN